MARSRWVGKTIGSLVILGALAGGGWWYVYGRAEPPPKFTTVAVTRGSIVQSVTASGTLQPVLSVDVSSQLSGRILEVLVDFNATVKKGDLLAKLDPATFQSSVAQAENELLNARAELRLTETETVRARRLFEQNLVSKSDLEKSEAGLEQAAANVSIRQSALESRKTDLGRCSIYAPIDGIVLTRNINPGQTVSASTSAPTLFVIANDLTKMQISAAISEADVGNVQPEQEVAFTVDAFPGQTFQGKVRQVRNSPKTVDSVVTYETVIDVSNPRGALRPGMTANVSIIVSRRDSALRLANAALRVRLPEALQPAMPEPPAGAPAGKSDSSEAAPGAEPAIAETGVPGGPMPGGAGTARGDGERRGRRSQRGGDGGNGFSRGSGGEGMRARMLDRPNTTRVVYKVVGTEDAPKLEALRVRTGISDSSYTEILGGAEEGDKFVTVVILPGAQAAAAQRPGPGGLPGMGGSSRGPGGYGGYGGYGRGF